MATTQLTQTHHKHRASAPIPAADRPEPTRAHRAGRDSDLPVAALLGIILLIVAAYFAARG